MTVLKNKIYFSADAAVADVQDGATIMFGGFGGAGFPHELIRAVGRKGTRNLFAISNNCGTGDSELGVLFKNKQIAKVIAAFPDRNPRISSSKWNPATWNMNSFRKEFSASACAPMARGFPRFFRR